MKIYICKNFSKPTNLVIIFISLFSLNGNYLNAEYFSEDSPIDTSTKLENDRSAIPTNPFEIVEMIRRQNSLNDATDPSDALDEALKSFHRLEEK